MQQASSGDAAARRLRRRLVFYHSQHSLSTKKITSKSRGLATLTMLFLFSCVRGGLRV